jgi:hypothetical protein
MQEKALREKDPNKLATLLKRMTRLLSKREKKQAEAEKQS